MARRGRRSNEIRYRIELSDEERRLLTGLEGVADERTRIRARVLMRCDQAMDGGDYRNRTIARELGVSLSTVSRIKRRYVHEGARLSVCGVTIRGRRKLGAVAARRLMEYLGRIPDDGEEVWTYTSLARALMREGVVRSVTATTVKRAMEEHGLSLITPAGGVSSTE
jgi:transposase